MHDTVTALIPSIPPRAGRTAKGSQTATLSRALSSVLNQEYPVKQILVEVDHDRRGSTNTRNRALAGATGEWCAMLDDDDEWYPDHLSSLVAHARETGADVVYPWFSVINGWDPWPGREGQPFDRELLRTQNYIPITVLARTSLLKAVGGFRAKGSKENPCDDWGTWERLLNAGARFEHLPKRTWCWHWHPGNTNGRGDRW